MFLLDVLDVGKILMGKTEHETNLALKRKINRVTREIEKTDLSVLADALMGAKPPV